jgi:hypothetical protein
MILQTGIAPIYRIVLETSGANNFRIVELHRRDFAVFVSLSSRTNPDQGSVVRNQVSGEMRLSAMPDA